jgi:energy-coupling factor transport system permease protein
MHEGPLRRLDPRAKLMMMATASTFCMLTEDLSFLFVTLCALVLTLSRGGADMFTVARRCRPLLALIASLFVIQALFAANPIEGASDEPLLRLGELALLHPSGLLLAAALALRLIIIVTAAQILLEGEPRDYMLALTQMRVPYEIAFMVVMGLHFLPILRDEALNAYYCMQLRGVAFKRVSLPRKIRAYAGICLPVFVGTLRRADEMSTAMELRGLRACPSRTSMRRLRLKRTDVAMLALWPAAFVILYILWFIL